MASSSYSVAGSCPVPTIEQVARHDLVHLGEPVDALTVALGHHAEWLTVPYDQYRPVTTFRDQGQRLPHGRLGLHGDGRLEHGVCQLDLLHSPPDHIDRDVLRERGDATASGDRLSHPATRYRRHVGDGDRQRRTDAVRSCQIDILTRGDAGPARNHEHVAVGQVRGGHGVIEESHVAAGYRLGRCRVRRSR